MLGLGPGLFYRAHLLAFKTFFFNIGVIHQELCASCFDVVSLLDG